MRDESEEMRDVSQEMKDASWEMRDEGGERRYQTRGVGWKMGNVCEERWRMWDARRGVILEI